MLLVRLGRAVRAALWLLIALALALGAAGIVAGASLPPGDATRPELTARADARLALALAPIETGVGQIEGQLQQLVDGGKAVLVELHDQATGTSDLGSVADRLDAGDALVLAITQEAQQLRSAYTALPYGPASAQIGERAKARLLALPAAFSALAPMAADWQVASARATVASRLLAALHQHDLLAASAVLQASNKDAAGKAKTPDLAGAAATLRSAMGALADAVAIRDQLRQVLDTSVLNAWLERNQSWDQALQTYFRLGRTSRDPRVLQRAYAVEEAARKLLPKTNDALVVMLSEIEDSGLTAALIDLGQIRARLALVAQVD